MTWCYTNITTAVIVVVVAAATTTVTKYHTHLNNSFCLWQSFNNTTTPRLVVAIVELSHRQTSIEPDRRISCSQLLVIRQIASNISTKFRPPSTEWAKKSISGYFARHFMRICQFRTRMTSFSILPQTKLIQWRSFPHKPRRNSMCEKLRHIHISWHIDSKHTLHCRDQSRLHCVRFWCERMQYTGVCEWRQRKPIWSR